jgi:O-antigen ligase
VQSALSPRRPTRSLDPIGAPLTRPLPSTSSIPWPLLAAAVLATVSGAAIALYGLAGLYMCLSILGGAVILYDFRAGVVLLILLMPISHTTVFPHEMFGITGLNPLNLLLAATFGAYLVQSVFDGSLRRFLPRPLLWLYIAPIIAAGILGTRHVEDIVPAFFALELIAFYDVPGYLRDMVAKPLLMVVVALLVAAAVARSARPERFLIPVFGAVWAMGLLVLLFVFLAGGTLAQLALATERDFLAPLGLHANDLGRLYTVAYALLLFSWAGARHYALRFALLATMAMVMLALLLTFSRAAFAGVLVVSALYLLWRRNLRALTFLLVLGLGALALLPGVVFERVTTGFGAGLNAITAGRLEGIWIPLLPDVLASPVFGSGIGSILWADAMQTGFGEAIIGTTHPHNAYLETLLDMGIIGLALFALYFLHVWRGFGSLYRDISLSPVLRGFFLGAAAGLLGSLAVALVGGSLTPRPEQAFLWLAIGMMYGLLGKRLATA